MPNERWRCSGTFVANVVFLMESMNVGQAPMNNGALMVTVVANVLS